MAELRRKLRRLKLDRIDLVERGANDGATIQLFKQHDEERKMGNTEKADLLAKAKAIAEDRSLPLDKRRVGWEAARQIEYAERTAAPPDPKAVRLGMRLLEKRKALGLDQQEIAKAADLSPSSVSRLESGDTELPSQETISKLFDCGVLTLADLKAAGLYRGPVPQ